MKRNWKVGDLAKLSGGTIRTREYGTNAMLDELGKLF
ncbi:hypothetical protein BN000_04839 [Neobacillus massiliamazoniensis]|uniref:Uncharacterized protein n=1 Tax=Neobacillus massiliamazoniensis TaxID=1499688 RepID=A0A0U1P3C7_9BACI|nr:hypothetical protein BN000_04839 [Neobacillus massiliamazoniensis]